MTSSHDLSNGTRPAEEPRLEGMRRRDRGKEHRWIREFLERASYGYLATVVDGTAFLNSNLFVYDPRNHRIYLHTARTGRTPESVARAGHGTFTAAVMGRLLPAETALDFGVEYAAVMAYGELRLVPEVDEKRWALERLMEKYAPHLEPGRDYRPITDAELGRTAVHRLDITAWSGKEKVADADFPGAYSLPTLQPPIRVEPEPEGPGREVPGEPERVTASADASETRSGGGGRGSAAPIASS